MSALRTPKWMARPRPGTTAIQGVGRWCGRVALILVTFALFSLVTVDVSQACASGPGVTASATQTAQSAPQVAKQHLAYQADVSIVKLIQSLGDSVKMSAHCHGLCCGGSCCPGCMSGIIGVGWAVARDFALNLEFPPQQPPMTSFELDTQFRPPRIAL